jgi:hypothetical protein
VLINIREFMIIPSGITTTRIDPVFRMSNYTLLKIGTDVMIFFDIEKRR